MKFILLGFFAFAVVETQISRQFALEKWQVSIGFLCLAVVLHFLNAGLVQFFIKKRAPDYASSDEVAPGLQAWELTAGLGIVPKWVSWIGLLAISALLATVWPWIVGVVDARIVDLIEFVRKF